MRGHRQADRGGAAMSIIRVNPASVQDYARAAGEHFADARTHLDRLVQAIVVVRYFGPNASQFKTSCGDMAVTYSSRLVQDLSAIADAVRASTTAIASSLGGAPVAISFDGTPIGMPAVPASDGTVEVDVSALENLKPVVRAHMAAVRATLDEHLTRLRTTDWTGNAKDTAVDTVTRFTANANATSERAETDITTYIDTQISQVLAADRTGV